MKVEEIPDIDSSMANLKHDTESPVKTYLSTGNHKMIQEMLNRKEILPNDFIFSSGDKTLLHEAVIVSESPQLIETILKNGADINAVEKQTGNSALFFAALDLKLDVVSVLLNFKPNINIKNEKGQTIFTFLSENLIERKGTKKTELTAEQSDRLRAIIDMLKEYKIKSESIENLDDEDRPVKLGHDESGHMRNRV